MGAHVHKGGDVSAMPEIKDLYGNREGGIPAGKGDLP